MTGVCIPCLIEKHEHCSNNISTTKGCECCPPRTKRTIKRRKTDG